MKIFRQLFWIFLFSLVGEIVSIGLSSVISIPGSVIGMVLLFSALRLKWLKLEQVEEVGTWLTGNMALFFVPAGVGLMTNFDVLADVWLQLIIIMVVTVTIMMLIVGQVVQRVQLKTKTNDQAIDSKGGN